MAETTQLRVFVSHATEDSAFCHTIVAALRGAGADVWYDEHNLGSGRLADEILRELGSRPIFVVILSQHAFASRWVKRETDWAEELKERDPSRALLPVTAGTIARDDFGTDNGWLAYYSYKRVEAPNFAAFPPDEGARRLLHALGLTPAGEAPAPIAPQPSESADDLLTRARALIAQKKYAEALPLLERATQLAPGSFDAWANLGLARNEMGGMAMTCKPMTAPLLSTTSRHGSGTTRATRCAISGARRGVGRLRPGAGPRPESHAGLEQQGRRTQPPETVRGGADRLRPGAHDQRRMVQQGPRAPTPGRAEEALAAYDRALALDPNDADTWNNKGIALKALKRYEEAVVAYDRALALDPNYVGAWYNKAMRFTA